MNEQAIFEAALEIENPAKRRAFIEKACAGNAELRGRVDSLLQSHESAGSFLEVPAVGAPKTDKARPVDRTMDFTPRDSCGADDDKEEDRELALSFLQTSTKPDSLGVLGHYEILQILGQGGFGIVFKAFDEKLHRFVAIKVMSPQLAATSPPRKRFLREARAAAAIKHENIVQVYSVEEQPLPYLVMECVDGQTLAQKLDGSGPLETNEVLHIARQIASGLAAAHEKGRIHRDIKPGNILLEAGADQKVKITDFGLARVVDDASMTRTGMIAGTPMYMAPEQAMGKDLDHRADLFSFGSVLYQMASGRPPFRASTTIAVLRRVADDTPRPLREILPEIPAWLAKIVNKLLEKIPDNRYQTAKEVADLLARCQSELELNGQVTCVPEVVPAPPSVAGTPGELKPKRQENTDHTNPKFRLGIWIAAFAICATLMAVAARQFLGVGQKAISTNTANPTTPKLDRSASPDSDRVLAEWVISLGGTVQVDNQVNEIVLSSDLPKKAFYVSGVNLDANSLITDSDAALFANAKRLRRLYLANTRLTDDLAPHLAQCENLEELFLHGTRISRKTFAVCKNLKKLRTFFASGSVDAAVSQLQDCHELDYLSLSLSDLSDDGLLHLRSLKNLKTLEIKVTRVTDAGLESLKELRYLNFLDLKETAVMQAGVNRLHEQLPQCKIEWNGGVISPKFDSERVLAAWVLSLPSFDVLILNQEGGQVHLKSGDTLPATPFFVHTISTSAVDDITDDDLARIGKARGLVSLTLGAKLGKVPRVTDQGFDLLLSPSVAQSLTNLALHTAFPKVTDEGFVLLSRLEHIHLLVADSLPPGTGAFLAKLGKKPKLTRLVVVGNEIPGGWVQGIPTRMPDLVTLGITGCQLTTADIEGLSKLDLLKGLGLDNCGIDDQSLNAIRDVHRLEGFGLSRNPAMTDAAVAQLLAKATKLRNVGLDDTATGDQTFRTLATLPQLDMVLAARTRVTDNGVAELASCKTILWLHLNGNKRLTDLGLDSIAKMTALIELHIQNNPQLTEPAVRKLQAALPNCKITSDYGK